MQQPFQARPRDSGRNGRLGAADANRDLFRHPVQGMEDARPAQAAADSAEQTGAAVVRVDEVCARQAVRKCMPTAQIELVPDRHRLGVDAQAPEARGHVLARTEHAHVDPLLGHARRELPQVRDRAAALDGRDVCDLHPAGVAVPTASASWPRTQMAAASPPISQNGRKYCSERNSELTAAITSEMRSALTKP